MLSTRVKVENCQKSRVKVQIDVVMISSYSLSPCYDLFSVVIF